LQKFQRNLKKFVVTGGVVDQAGQNKAYIEELSKMLSREELLAKFVGMIKSPLYSFSGALNSGLGGFARALKAYGEKKEETN
jgi:large subunit ribosomal protein L10